MSTQISAEEQFVRYVEAVTADGYLDDGEQRAAMMKAGDLGLDANHAMSLLIRTTASRNAVLESVAKSNFLSFVTQQLGDRFLSVQEYDDCIERGLQDDFFGRASNRLELAKGLVEEALRAERAVSELSVRERVKRLLDAESTASGGYVSKERWADIVRRTNAELGQAGVDLVENDIDGLLANVLQEHGARLGSKKGPARLFAVALLGLALLVVGAFALGGKREPLAAVDLPPVETVAPIAVAGVKLDLPSCNAVSGILKALDQRMAANIRQRAFTTPADDSLNRWAPDALSACEPYAQLPPQHREQAIGSCSAWGYCNNIDGYLDTLESKYVEWSSDKNCMWIGRCLKALPHSERCRVRGQEMGCATGMADAD